jgi:hypothetical protein
VAILEASLLHLPTRSWNFRHRHMTFKTSLEKYLKGSQQRKKNQWLGGRVPLARRTLSPEAMKKVSPAVRLILGVTGGIFCFSAILDAAADSDANRDDPVIAPRAEDAGDGEGPLS